MMVKPSVGELLEKVEDRYQLVVMTSRRARQLADGAIPLTSKKEHSKVTMAAQEIADGSIRIVKPKIKVEAEGKEEKEDKEKKAKSKPKAKK